MTEKTDEASIPMIQRANLIYRDDTIYHSHVIPVECKAGNHMKAKSMMVNMEN